MKARYFQENPNGCLRFEQKPIQDLEARRLVPSLLAGASVKGVARYLFLYRLRGRLTGWTAFTPSKTSLLSDSLYVAPMPEASSPISVRLIGPEVSGDNDSNEGLPSWSAPDQYAVKYWVEGLVLGEGRCAVDDEICLQVYAFQRREAKDDRVQLSARSGRPWDCTYAYTHEGSDQELRGIKEKVYFVSHIDPRCGTRAYQYVSSWRCFWCVTSALLVLLIASSSIMGGLHLRK